MDEIDNFDGEYKFLSNFYYCEITLEGEVYPTLEHAYQASKTFDLEIRRKIRLASTPSIAKRIGRSVPMRPDWEQVKEKVMKGLLLKKFDHEELRRKLLETQNAILIEGNNWGDVIWGCIRENGSWVGENKLGKLLMEVREACGKTYLSSG